MECSCCLEALASGAVSVTLCCKRLICQQCLPEISQSGLCFCAQNWLGVETLKPIDRDQQSILLLNLHIDLEYERVRMEIWFSEAAKDHVVWNLQLPLLDHYRSAQKRFELLKDAISRIKAFPSGFCPSLPHIVFEPPGHVIYHPHVYLLKKRGPSYIRRNSTYPISIQPHSFAEFIRRYRKLTFNRREPGWTGRYPRYCLPSDNLNLTEDIVAEFPDMWNINVLVNNPNLSMTFLENLINKHYLYQIDRKLAVQLLSENLEWSVDHYALSQAKNERATWSDQKIIEYHRQLNGLKTDEHKRRLAHELSYPGRALSMTTVDAWIDCGWNIYRLLENPHIKWDWL